MPTLHSSSVVLSIPVELTEHCLTFCSPVDVANFSQTCRRANSVVYRSGDQYLWRQLFVLYPFDDPRKSLHVRNLSEHSVTFDWRYEIQRRLTAKAVAFAGEKRASELQDALETFIHMIQNSLPVSAGQGYEPSHNISWVSCVLRDSQLLDWDSPLSETPLRSQLLSYLALSLSYCKDISDVKSREYLYRLRTKSRAIVYDLRNYKKANMWGPYKPDGEGNVNWVHVEGIINVVWMNLVELSSWIACRPPVGLEATRAYSAPGTPAGSVGRKDEDWAGVEGTWRRYVCFMDYRDLFAYNFSSVANGPHNPSFFDNEMFQEATRLIELKLRLIPHVDISTSTRFRPPPGSTLDNQYAPLHFGGTSIGVNGNEATVEGCVRMGEDGVARWQFGSLYNGHSQWSSEGVQVGNVASAAGIVGIWTGTLHDREDPVGPFWLWKVEDGCPSHFI